METFAQQMRQADTASQVHLLFDYMKERGQENYEEDVSQYQHSLQTACLAHRSEVDEVMQTAALLHDIGHMLAEDQEGEINPTLIDDYHENMGASFLGEFFPLSVTEPIRLHVQAKRYMCSTDTAYFEGLSKASQKSFHLQGGAMSELEIKEFEANPFYQSAILLRKWDDQAKLVGLEIPEIEQYEEAVLKSLV